MSDLVAFLRARLGEDEAAAKAAYLEGPAGQLWVSPALGRHISRHDPTRVLREVEAKRRILDEHGPEPGQHPGFCWHDKHEMPCPTVRALAAVYRDHPDYDPAWA